VTGLSQNEISNFKSIYDRLFNKIQDNQNLDEQDWSSLQNEYQIWENAIEYENNSIQKAIESESKRLQALRKEKIEAEKVVYYSR